MRTKEPPRRAEEKQPWTVERLTRWRPFLRGTRLGAILLTAASLTQGTILGSCRPFGLGFAAAWGCGWEGASALLGVLAGTLLLRPLAPALRYAAAAVLLFAANLACFDLKIVQNPLFRPVLSALSAAVTGFLYLSGTGWTRETALCWLWETVLTGVSCHFFGELTQKQLSGVLWLALGGIVTLGTLSPSAGVLSAALVTLLASRGGAEPGAVSGGLLGLGAGLASGSGPVLGGILCVCGMAAGSLSQRSRLLRLAVFAVTGTAAGSWWDGSGTIPLLLAAVLVGSLLPERFFLMLEGRMGLRLPKSAGVSPSSAEAVRYQLEEQSTAFRTLFQHIYDSVERGEPPESSGVIIDRTAERLCRSCDRYELCWKRDHLSTTQAMTHALSRMLDRGSAKAEDFRAFSRQCVHFEELVQLFNQELYRFWNRRQYRVRMKNNRLAVCRQYAQLSGLLENAAQRLGEPVFLDRPAAARAEYAAAQLGQSVRCIVRRDSRGRHTLELRGSDLERLNTKEGAAAFSRALGAEMEPADVFRTTQGQRLILRQRPPLTVKTAVASRQKQEGQVSGDNGIWFRDSSGVLWVILCDGMGSGAPAAGESRLLMTLLKDFLHAGIQPEAALTTLTGALSLRGELDGGFTTVDLLKIDLFTGGASLHKLGSAPTYLRKNGSVSRITGSSLPAGLETDRETVPDSVRFTVSEGDLLLLVTDGITDGSSDGWLRKLAAQYRGESPRELAQSVLSSPGAGREDDRTVVTVQVGKRV